MAGKNNRSIVTDKQLRLDVAMAVCKALNKFALERNPDLPKEQLYTEEEIINWVNNPDSVNAYLQAQGEDIGEVGRNIQNQYKADPLYTGNKGGSRFGHLLIEKGDSPINKDHNQHIVNFIQNEDTLKDLAYDFVDIMDNTDPYEFVPVSGEDITKNYEKISKTQKLGFVFYDTVGILHSTDRDLAARITSVSNLVQSDTLTAYNNYNRNPYSMLIPPKNDMEYFINVSSREYELKQAIVSVSPDLKEFDYLSPDEVITKMSKTSFADFSTSASIKDLHGKESLKIRKLIDDGIITKGFISNYTFKNEKGEIVSFKNVVDSYKDGQLTGGIRKVELTPEEKERAAMLKQTVRNKAKLIELDIYSRRRAEKNDLKNGELKSALEDFSAKYAEFVANKNGDINRFVESNKALLDNIDKYRQDLLAEEQRQYLDRKENEAFVAEHQKNKSLNYAGLAAKATQIKQNTFGAKYPQSLRNFEESVFLYHDDVKEARGDFKKALTEKEIQNNLSVIYEIGVKDKEYNNRGFIGKWWYKNSHNQMMESKTALIDNLVNLGADRDTLNALGTKNNDLDGLGKMAKELNATSKTLLDSANVQADKLYERLITNPEKKINQLKERLEDLEAKKYKDFMECNAFDKKLHEKFRPDFFEHIATLDIQGQIEFTQQYDAWLEQNPQDNKKYQKLSAKSDATEKEYYNTKKELADRESAFEYGKEYDMDNKENQALEEQLKDSDNNIMNIHNDDLSRSLSSLSKEDVIDTTSRAKK